MSKPPVLPSSPLLNLIFVMAIVAAGFFLVLKVGFVLHNDPQPTPIDSPVLTAVAVFVLLVGAGTAVFLVARSIREALVRTRLRKEAKEWAASHAEARRLRVLELAADPARAKYAPLVEAGEVWSDEDIAYSENPHRTVTCVHLQKIEESLRQAGVPLRRYREQEVSATCCIDFDGLHRDFDCPPPVRYAEFYAGERTEYDHPVAFLICDEHQSIIHTIHPEAGSAKNVQGFPSGAVR